MSVCLIICAGGFVRMTGAGMGCPDWPKCFGQWIPPTTIEHVPVNYKQIYSDRGYDKLNFNVFNTWAEYINRLIGAIGGVFCFLLFVSSLFTRKLILILLSVFLVFLMAFQAWMGALVVFSILSPFKITIHMLIALLIICLLFFLFRISSAQKIIIDTLGSKWIYLGLLISFTQIILGTQVRESVDLLLDTIPRNLIINHLPNIFEFHRSMAWLILISNSVIIFNNRKFFHDEIEQKLIIGTVICLLISGIIMSYFSIIGLTQLIHLLGAFSLFICQFSMLLRRLRLPILKSL